MKWRLLIYRRTRGVHELSGILENIEHENVDKKIKYLAEIEEKSGRLDTEIVKEQMPKKEWIQINDKE